MISNKRGQFFLLAAVIISVVAISLGVTSNLARVSKDPKGFYDFTYEVERETGAVMDYEIYTDFSDGCNLTEFIELLAKDIRDRDPSSNFIFIYGDNVSGLVLKNYGATSADIHGTTVVGSGTPAISDICLGGYCQNVSQTFGTFPDDIGTKKFSSAELSGETNISVTIEEQNFVFPISEHRQVIFIIQKDVEDESFVAVK